MKYSGSCQCGKVTFDVDTEIEQVISCNCSRCRRIGSLLAAAPKEKFKLKSGEGALTEFKFNKHLIHHYFRDLRRATLCRGQRPRRQRYGDGQRALLGRRRSGVVQGDEVRRRKHVTSRGLADGADHREKGLCGTPKAITGGPSSTRYKLSDP
jgi:hypothetical protein